jgi:hypothetical protein
VDSVCLLCLLIKAKDKAKVDAQDKVRGDGCVFVVRVLLGL